MKQTIKVTENATYMMKLPCVCGCYKENGKLVYLLYETDTKAHIGDWLGEDEKGRWHILETSIRENNK